MNPKARPVDIELVKGIKTRIKNVGNHSLKSANFTNLNCCIIMADRQPLPSALDGTGLRQGAASDRIAVDRYLPPLRQPFAEAADIRPSAARGEAPAAVLR